MAFLSKRRKIKLKQLHPDNRVTNKKSDLGLAKVAFKTLNHLSELRQGILQTQNLLLRQGAVVDANIINKTVPHSNSVFAVLYANIGMLTAIRHG